jgi:hypothetical protein
MKKPRACLRDCTRYRPIYRSVFQISIETYADPDFYLYADQDPDPVLRRLNQYQPMRLRIRTLVGLCRQKKLDFDMKNIPYERLIIFWSVSGLPDLDSHSIYGSGLNRAQSMRIRIRNIACGSLVRNLRESLLAF